MSKKLAPIILFVYNRLEHTQQTIKALQKNLLANDSELFIFSDGPKDKSIINSVEKLRAYLKTIDGFKNITLIERTHNYGLARNIIEGVDSIIFNYGKVIVLEDDLITSRYFLDYMNKALNMYENNEKIWSVTGFSFSTKFMNFPDNYLDTCYLNIRPMSWSWGTWADRWNTVDWEVNDFKTFINDKNQIKAFNKGGTDLTRMLKNQMKGKINSWYIRWTYNAIQQKKFTIYPKISYINNIGHDITGTHCVEDSNDIYSHTELNNYMIETLNSKPILNKNIVKNFNKAFNTNYIRIIKRKFKKLLYKFYR